jgi:hypothetical protein
VTSVLVADPFAVAADIIDPPKEGLIQYHDDPAGFVLNCIIWPEGHGPTEYQLDVLGMIPKQKRVSARGPHGLGKTSLAAWTVLWFALTRDAAGEDWKAPTTASVWRQLEKYLWPEIHKWVKKIDWETCHRRPLREGDELLDMAIKLRTGAAFAVASDEPAKIEGAHADQLLYVYDESKTIPADTFDASEGAFSGAGEDTASEAYAIANSTPGEPQGRFYEIQKRKPGTEDWTVRFITQKEVIKSGRMSKGWAKQRAKQWGETSAVFINRVLGEFASSEEDTVIPLAWVEAANERWLEWGEIPGVDNVGADIARSGKDKTVLAIRRGEYLDDLERYTKQGTMESAARIEAVIMNRNARATVDVIGIGAGVVDRLRQQGYDIEAFNAAEATPMLDRSEELGFTNCRSAAWWNLREMLDPDSGFSIALPPDDLLTGDLTAPHWRVMAGGRIQVEKKEDIIKRLGRSPDDGDAAVMAYWPGQPIDVEDVIEEWEPVQIGADI